MPKKVAWKHIQGKNPNTVTAYEREHGGTVYLKWYEDRKTRRRSLRFRVRGPDGKLLKRSVMEAKAQAKERHQILAGHRDEPEPDSLTLERGYEMFFTPETGRYSISKRDVRENAPRLTRLVLDVLGPTTRWSELRGPSVTTKLIRTLARNYLDKKGGGLRQSERAISQLFTVARWLYSEGHVSDELEPSYRWRKKLKVEWKEMVGGSTTPARLRYDKDEFRSFTETVYCPDSEVDPRGRLLFVFGIGQRVEQVLELWRDETVEPDSSEEAEFGKIQIPETEKKLAGWMYLTKAQQAHLLTALNHGYLSTLEAAYQAGEIKNYPIFPTGPLKDRRSQLAGARQPLNRTWALKQFRKIEALAGIEKVEGRGFRALRRSYADRAGVHDAAEWTKAREQGWEKPSTGRIYQNRDDSGLLQESRKLRDAVLSSGSPPSSETGDPVEKDLVEEVQRQIREGRLDPQRLLEILGAEISDEAV